MTTSADFEVPEVSIYNPDDFKEPIKDPIGVAAFFVAGLAAAANSTLDVQSRPIS